MVTRWFSSLELGCDQRSLTSDDKTIQVCSLQKIVVTRRIQGQISHSLGVHQHVVLIPEMYVGQLLRQNALDLCRELLTSFLIDLQASLVDERIPSGTGHVAAIGSTRR